MNTEGSNTDIIQPMTLQLKSLSKLYQTPKGNIQVLDQLDLQLKKGESTAILGPSGSGKSTLLALIAGLDHPTSGQVILAGQDLSTLTENQLTRFRAQELGIIFQQFHLLQNLTALENIRLPLELAKEKQAQVKALELVEAVGLSDRKDHFPKELSGGECQRVAIARALSTQPALLLADEPTGNLDEKTGAKLRELIFSLAAKNNMTLLLVTHDQQMANHCQKKLYLKAGRLHEHLG